MPRYGYDSGGDIPNLGLGLASLGPSPSTLSSLTNARAAQTTTTKEDSGDTLGMLAKVAGGVGGLFTGGSTLYATLAAQAAQGAASA